MLLTDPGNSEGKCAPSGSVPGVIQLAVPECKCSSSGSRIDREVQPLEVQNAGDRGMTGDPGYVGSGPGWN